MGPGWWWLAGPVGAQLSRPPCPSRARQARQKLRKRQQLQQLPSPQRKEQAARCGALTTARRSGRAQQAAGRACRRSTSSFLPLSGFHLVSSPRFVSSSCSRVGRRGGWHGAIAGCGCWQREKPEPQCRPTPGPGSRRGATTRQQHRRALPTCSCCTFMVGGSKPSSPSPSALLPAARSAACAPRQALELGEFWFEGWLSALGRPPSNAARRAQLAPTALAASSSSLSLSSASARCRLDRSSSLAAERAFCTRAGEDLVGRRTCLPATDTAPRPPCCRSSGPRPRLQPPPKPAPAAARPPRRCGWPGSRHPPSRPRCAPCAAVAPWPRSPAAGRRTRRRAPTAGQQAGGTNADDELHSPQPEPCCLLALWRALPSRVPMTPQGCQRSHLRAPREVQPCGCLEVPRRGARQGGGVGGGVAAVLRVPVAPHHAILSLVCTHRPVSIRVARESSGRQLDGARRKAGRPRPAALAGRRGGAAPPQLSAPCLSSRQVSFLMGFSHSLESFSPACKDTAPCI